MLPFKNILFPIDFSEHSSGAARYVEAFAGRFESKLTLLHVIEPPNARPGRLSPLPDRLSHRKSTP
jgi:nucleotide-binding universal stress UspA family protein